MEGNRHTGSEPLLQCRDDAGKFLDAYYNAKRYYASSKNIEFKKVSSAQKNKVQLWLWRTSTTMNSYVDKAFFFRRLYVYADGGVDNEKTYWVMLPTCVAKNKSNCTLYTTCP